jgi:hypothetical protein
MACSKLLLDFNTFRDEFIKTQNDFSAMKMVKVEPFFDFEQTMEVEANIPSSDTLETISALPLAFKTDESVDLGVDAKDDTDMGEEEYLEEDHLQSDFEDTLDDSGG